MIQTVKTEELMKRLLDVAVDGIGLWAVSKATEYLKPFSIKYLKQYNDPAIKIGLSIADVIVPQIRTVPYVGDWLSLAGRQGVNELLGIVIDNKPVCWAEDENTIKCVHMDTTNVSVKIDGASVTPTISGTPDELTINLPSILSAGAHDLIVVGERKAFSGKIYV